MKRLVGVYNVSELEQLIEGVPGANLMHGVMLKVINAYLETYPVQWFACRREDWEEIALMTVQQSYRTRGVLYDAGRLLYQNCDWAEARHRVPILAYTTLKNPQPPSQGNVYVYVPSINY